MSAQLLRLWDRHWFAPDAARNLAMARLLAAGTALWVLLSRDRAGVSGLDTAFWAGVAPSTRWRFLLFPGHERLEHFLVLVTTVLLVGALIGVRARVCAFAAGLLLYHLAPLESIVWTSSPAGRGLTLPALTLLLCGIAPSADALTPGAGESPPPSWSYGWPLRLLQLWLVNVYFFSGLGKLRTNGLAWASASNLSHWLHLATQDEQIAVYHSLGAFMAAHPLVAGATGAGTLVFEFGIVAALFSKRWRPWLATAAMAFHLGIYFAMNITLNSWPLLLTFYDWDSRSIPAPAERAVVS
jgi:hypothetical protein